MQKYTALRLNWELLKDYYHNWSETTIYERNKRLTDIIAEIWPFADGI